MKITLYLPDDLHGRVKAVPDLNVSAILQQALEAELARRQALAERTEKMTDVELTVERVGNTTYEVPRTVVFTGTSVHASDSTEAFITEHGRIAVYDDAKDGALYVYEDLAELEEDVAGELVADVAEALGESRAVRLDI